MTAKIAVIIGSTRQGRHTDKLARWVATNLKKSADVELLDLRDYPIPFLDEAVSPRFNPNRTPDVSTKKWLDKVIDFDGFVFVSPEYNRSIPAVLKNAIDVIGHELDDKPAALVAHGVSGGAQAIANLRMALPGIGVSTIPQAIYFTDRLADSFDEDGNLNNEIAERPYGPQSSLDSQIKSLLWYTEALKSARS